MIMLRRMNLPIRLEDLMNYIVPVDREGAYMQFPDHPGTAYTLLLARYIYWEKVSPDERN